MAEKTRGSKTPYAGDAAPDKIKVTAMQAGRLEAMSGVPAKELAGLSIADISDKYRWRIEPELLFFRKICGKVVKRDPVTGIEYPVAYATVHVEDNDCSFVGYFPKVSKWAWYFPFKCRREEIATVKTDKCGNFCVYVPRWDIDWILRFRRERHCYPVIFERPTIADLLGDLIVREPVHFPPKPGPDPDPSWLLRHDRGQLLAVAEQHLGRDAARKLGAAIGNLSFGGDSTRVAEALQDDAFGTSFAPPLPDELRLVQHERPKKDSPSAVHSTLGAQLQLDASVLKSLDLARYIGPFRRCYDLFIPEWVPFFDVPDITFKVTQDVDGDGTEETISSEGFFQIRWNAGPLSNVKLIASPIAISIPECGEIIDIPCGNVPEIVRAGRMPVRGDATMYDPVAGYAVRPNRPIATGNPGLPGPLPRPAAQSPFYGTVPIYGCVNVATTATQYRILDSYSANGIDFSPFLPIRHQAWWVTRLDAAGITTQYHYVTPDANGWYPIVIPTGTNPNAWEPPNLLLDWDTTSAGDGKHILKIQLGIAGVPLSPQPATDPVAFNVDNAAPQTTFAVEYRKNGVGPFLPLVFPCPLVRRGAVPQDVEFRVTFTASARHLRDVSVSGGGCGAGDILYQSGAPALWYASGATGIAHWHVDVGDNAASVTAFFSLSATAHQGTYSFNGWAASRALNPAGGDTGHLQVPMYEYDPADKYSPPSFAFSVIDAD